MRTRLSVWKALAKAGYVPNREGDLKDIGVIGTQEIRCAKHNTLFKCIPTNNLKPLTQVGILPHCWKCALQVVREADNLQGIGILNAPHKLDLRVVKAAQDKFAKNKEHSVDSIEGSMLRFSCYHGGSFLSTLSAENGGLQTQCINSECAIARSKRTEVRKVKTWAGKFNEVERSQPWSRGDDGIVVCDLHGRKNVDNYRCYVCQPRPEYLNGKTLAVHRKDIEAKRKEYVKAVCSAKGIAYSDIVLAVCSKHSYRITMSDLPYTLTDIRNQLTCVKCLRHFMLKALPDTTADAIKQGQVTASGFTRITGYTITGTTLSGAKCQLSEKRGFVIKSKASNIEQLDEKSVAFEGFAKEVLEKNRTKVLLHLIRHRHGPNCVIKAGVVTGATCGHDWALPNNPVAHTACPECGKKARHSSLLSRSKSRIQEKLKGNKSWTLVGVVKHQNKSRKLTGRISCVKCGYELNIRDGIFPSTCKRCETKGQSSEPAKVWLLTLERILGQSIQGCSSKEFAETLDGVNVRYDGFLKDKNLVLEFLGDYYHGNPKTFPEKTKAYSLTWKRLHKIARTRSVVYVWESDFKAGNIVSGFIGTKEPGGLLHLVSALATLQKH